ncbi:MAG: hypothetical protein MI757_04975 [Pirellulales bacterium]|nr:hypothetical protein [Pirellulales bacterium]
MPAPKLFHEPLISLVLHRNVRQFAPGDELAAEYQIDAVDPADIRAIEVSVLWHTEGKGEEDLAVHFFERLAAEDDDNYMNLHQLRRFSTTLPNSPLSYEGVNLKIRWSARLRLFMPQGKEYVADVPFQLGDVPSPKVHEHGSDHDQDPAVAGKISAA